MNDHHRLMKELQETHPVFEDWEFEYEYPGYFVYHRPSAEISVYFTPDHSRKNVIDIMAASEEEIATGEAPFTERTAENLFQAVRPWLEKYGQNSIQNPKRWRPRKKPSDKRRHPQEKCDQHEDILMCHAAPGSCRWGGCDAHSEDSCKSDPRYYADTKSFMCDEGRKKFLEEYRWDDNEGWIERR